MRVPTASRQRQRVAAVAAAWPHLAPIAIAAIALALRMHGLGDKPFWLDEVVSFRRATVPFAEVIAASVQNNHYPSYFLLLWLVAKIGTSQWLLRLPSAIFGSLGAGLVCLIGREADGLRTGIAAGLLLALSPFDVQYGQEARSYTLVASLILVALWGLVRLGRDPALAARPLRIDRLPPGAWLAYGGGTAAALNVLNVAVGWLLAANLAALVIACRSGDARRTFLRNWGIVQGLVVAAWLPALVAVLAASKNGLLAVAGWAPTESLASIWAVAAPVYLDRIAAFITFDLLPPTVPGRSIVIAVLAAAGAWRLLRREPNAFAIIGSAGIGVPLLLLLVSLYKPILVPRYFGWSAAPFFVLAGAGVAHLKARYFAAGAATLTVACLINLLPYYSDETKPRWDLLAAQLQQQVHDGDVVLLNNWYADYVMQAFVDRTGLADRRLVLTSHPRKAVAALLPHHNLWVVYGRAGQAVLPTPSQYMNSLSALGRPSDEQRFGRYVVLWRLTPDALAGDCTAAPAGSPPQPATGNPC